MAAADELFVEGDAALAEGTFVCVVGREVAPHEAEDRPIVELHRRPAPEAPNPDDEAAQVFDQIDQQAQGLSLIHI